MLALALTVLVQSAPSPDTSIARFRATISAAISAVEGDSGPRVAHRWQSRAGRDPAALLGLATLDRLTYDYASADRLYALLQAQAPAVPNPIHLYATQGLGLSRAARWQYAPALTALESARAEAVALGDRRAAVEAMLTMAALRGRTQGADSARVTLEHAAAQLTPADTSLMARTQCALGSLLRGSNLRRADTLARLGLRLATSGSDGRALGVCLSSLASVLEANGLQDSAYAKFTSARDQFTTTRDLHALAGVNQWLAFQGIQYAANFWLGKQYALLAIQGGRRTGNAPAEAWAQLNLAQLGVRMGDIRTAQAYTDTAKILFERLGDRAGLSSITYLRGQAALLDGRPAEAIRAFGAVDSMNAAIGITNFRAATALQTSVALRLAGRLEESSKSLATAEETARRLGILGIQSDAKYEHGLLSLARGAWDDAVLQFDAFKQHVGVQAWQFHLDADIRRAEALAHSGRFDEAEAAFDAGLIGLARRRYQSLYNNREGQLALLQSRRFDIDPDLGVATTVDLFAGAGRAEAAFRIAEAWRGHYLLTRIIRVRGIGGKGSGEIASVFLPDSEDIATLPTRLPDSTALLMFVTGRGAEATTLFTVTRAGIRTHTLPASDSLIEPITRFNAALEGGSPARALAARLGGMIFGPATGALDRSITRLLIVPDGPFYRLPFDALLLPDGGLAVERYAVALSPSTRLAARWWVASPPSPGGRTVVFGDPVFRSDAVLPRLPNAGAEARSIAAMTASPVLLVRGAASEHALKTTLAGAGVLHLATHAEVSDFGILTSGLELAPGGGDDGHVGVDEIARLKLDGAMVVLSGCRTVGGAIVNGEGLQGLTTPFLEAGARAIVATQWAVGDRTMADLMRGFYRALSEGAPVAEALRRAKLEALRHGAPPSVWASLVLVGDPALRPRVF